MGNSARCSVVLPSDLRPLGPVRQGPWTRGRTRTTLAPVRAKLCLSIVLPIAAAASGGAQPAEASPHTRACGTVTKATKTLSLRAANMSCVAARQLLLAPTNARAEVIGHKSFFYTASDCEGIVWRRHEFDYSQRHGGKLPRNAKFVRFTVIRDCVG